MEREQRIDKKRLLFDNKALAALILPLIVEQLLAVLVGMADSIMVASVGETAVSGVSLVDNIMVLFINLFAALATGGAVIAGQYLGQRNEKQSCRACLVYNFYGGHHYGAYLLRKMVYSPCSVRTNRWGSDASR